ncbi:hypothetical protein COHA_004348 [Chlorella ohadii]|uniref:Uncharacterized protein n=1 Tax=Chlorella ohadii TaxID=2649997 RepID=A0AAD5H2J6_9CHLO|nr:hypothetical protein COHA_004348 [Chlorella ohadii]
MWVTEEQAPAARLAAQLAAQGLAAGLPPADTADPGMQDSLLKLCRMLSKKGHWDLLDLLVAGPCASLFATEAGVMDLVDLGTDTQGRLRLTKALPALAERCAAQGRVEGVAALLVFAEEGGCINVTELAQTVCATLDNAAGTVYLYNLKKDRQERLCDAICKHAAGEHAACLLAVLKSLPQSQLDARRVVAQALVKAARLQCADLPTDVRGFYGDLSALVEEVQRQLHSGMPAAPNPGGWALPDDIVQHFHCNRSPPGQHCRLCQPVVAFMRGTRLETLPALRFEEGGLQDNMDHLERQVIFTVRLCRYSAQIVCSDGSGCMLGACERHCALEAYLEKAVFTVDSKTAVQGKGKKSGPKPQVAAVRLKKLDAWYTDKAAAHRGLRQAAHVLQAMLALAPVPAAAAAPAVSPVEVTAAAVARPARQPAAVQQQQQAAVQPLLAAATPAVQKCVSVQPAAAAAAAKAVQQQQAVQQPTAAAGTQAAQKRRLAAQPAAVQPAAAAATRTVQQQQQAAQTGTTAATKAVLVRRKAAHSAAAAPKAVPKQQAEVQPVAPAETAAVVQEQSAVEAVPAQQAQQAQQAGTAAAAEVTERVHAAAPATCAADQLAPVHEAPAEAQPAVKVPAAEPAPAMDATAEAAAAVVEPAEAAVAAVTAQGIEAVEVDAAVEGAAEVAAAAEEPAVAAEAAATAQGIEAMEVDAAVAAEAAAAAATAEPEAATEAAAAAPAKIEAMEAEGQLEQAAPAAAGPAEAAPAASAAAAEPDAVPAASAAAATPGAPAAAAQLLVAEDSSVLGATQGTPAASRSLVQRTLLSNGSLSRMPPPEQGASQGKLAGRRLSLGPQSTAKSAASGSTGRKRPAAGSTAKKGGGPGSRTRALLARDAQRLRLVGRLPMLYEWFKTENQHLSEAECSSLATSKLAPRRLDWQDAGQEVDSEAVQAPAAAAASAAAAGPAAERGKRSRRG